MDLPPEAARAIQALQSTFGSLAQGVPAPAAPAKKTKVSADLEKEWNSCSPYQRLCFSYLANLAAEDVLGADHITVTPQNQDLQGSAACPAAFQSSMPGSSCSSPVQTFLP